MPEPIDFALYQRVPKLESLSAIALARKLIRNAPPDLGPRSLRALQRIRSGALAVQGAIKDRARTKQSIRPIDLGFDNGWTALRDSLERWSRVLSPAFEAERSRAAQLITLYFADGVEFVKLSYDAEWEFSEQLLQRFDEEGAVADIERLAGAPFLANVRHFHARLGEALGLNVAKAPETASSTGLVDALSELSAAIAEYLRRYSGEIDTDRPEDVKAFRKAVQPIDDYRASFAATGRPPAEDEGDSPAEPVPEVTTNQKPDAPAT